MPEAFSKPSFTFTKSTIIPTSSQDDQRIHLTASIFLSYVTYLTSGITQNDVSRFSTHEGSLSNKDSFLGELCYAICLVVHTQHPVGILEMEIYGMKLPQARSAVSV